MPRNRRGRARRVILKSVKVLTLDEVREREPETLRWSYASMLEAGNKPRPRGATLQNATPASGKNSAHTARLINVALGERPKKARSQSCPK